MSQEIKVLGNQAGTGSLQSNGSTHLQTSDTLILNSYGGQGVTSIPKTDSPAIFVVTHTGDLVEDNKDNVNSLLTLETKRDILEALQRSGLDNNEITTVVVEDPILHNFGGNDGFKVEGNRKTTTSNYQHPVVLLSDPTLSSSFPRPSQTLLVQDVPTDNKQDIPKATSKQETESDMKQVLNLLWAFQRDKERQDREQKKFLESMHQENLAMFHQCLGVLKDVKELIVKCLDEKPSSSKNLNRCKKSHLLPTDVDVMESHCDKEDGESTKSKDSMVKEVTKQRLHSCEICGKMFVRVLGLERHKRIHTRQKSFTTNLCNLKLTQADPLHEHNKAQNSDKPFVCDVCGRGFNHRSVMARHKLIHTGHRPHVCNVCGKRFSRSDDLKVHQRVHRKAWLCQCDVCGKGFKHKVNLQRHMMIHAEVRQYKHWCDVCGKGFSTSSHLREHFLTHTGEKPFICDICGKGCSSQTLLKRHKVSHADEKPFKCDICNKGFITNAHVKRHKLSKHKGAKPYVCDLCNVAFENLVDLKMHSLTHV